MKMYKGSLPTVSLPFLHFENPNLLGVKGNSCECAEVRRIYVKLIKHVLIKWNYLFLCS